MDILNKVPKHSLGFLVDMNGQFMLSYYHHWQAEDFTISRILSSMLLSFFGMYKWIYSILWHIMGVPICTNDDRISIAPNIDPARRVSMKFQVSPLNKSRRMLYIVDFPVLTILM